MSLPTSRKSVETLRNSLQAKAKSEPSYRFYSLWDKVCREDVLREAFRRSRANAGLAGVDGVGFDAIEALGALASVRAAETSDRQAEQQFKAETDGLRSSVSARCPGCYFASMLGLVFPLPVRYSAQLSPLEDHCVSFISPGWTLQRAPRPEDARSLRLGSGMIKYCSVAELRDEVRAMKKPDRQLVRGSLSISIWTSTEEPSARTMVYASNGQEALWISDPNPYLGDALLDAAMSAAVHSQ
jgi:hypothetical protein